MRYFAQQPEIMTEPLYGRTYECDHPVYSKCTLYTGLSLGLAVIQQRYRKEDKSTYWTEIDPWLVDQIYIQPGFIDLFKKKAWTPDQNGAYPTMTVRQVMWALKMKPLHKELWETVFDHNPI